MLLLGVSRISRTDSLDFCKILEAILISKIYFIVSPTAVRFRVRDKGSEFGWTVGCPTFGNIASADVRQGDRVGIVKKKNVQTRYEDFIENQL